jgi:hypothetical protein
MRRVWLGLFLATFTSATAASAQDAAARAAHTFVVSGAPGLGLFWRGSDATDVGIFLNGSATSQKNQDSRSISIEPTVRHYWRPEARLTPYTHLALAGTWTRRKVENPRNFATVTTETRTLGLGIEAALGLEWFPIERVSVGGHAGPEGQPGVEQEYDIRRGDDHPGAEPAPDHRRHAAFRAGGPVLLLNG